MRTLCGILGGLVFALASGAALAEPGPASSMPAPAKAASANPAPPTPVSSARVIMLKLMVSDLDRSERFYHEVFGTTAVQRMGDNVRILVFPGGATPGIIMIKSANADHEHSSFVMQVPDYRAALDRAAANGGRLLNTRFAQDLGGMAVRSSHFLDPDGNNVEVLQIGQPK